MNTEPVIENRMLKCQICGKGPWNGREQEYRDTHAKTIRTECVWICGRCGQQFKRGLISVKSYAPEAK